MRERDRHIGDFGPGFRPVEWVLSGYLALTALLLVSLGRSLPGAGSLVGFHVLAILAMALLGRFGTTLPTPLATARRLYPLLVGPLLYMEVATLNDLFWGERYFDTSIIAAERALFGANVSQVWSEAWPWTWWSELAHLAYLSYYALAPLLWISLAARRQWARMEEFLTAVALTFVTCQLWFISLPVTGPYHHFGPLDPPAPGSMVPPLVHAVIGSASSVGTAFPSSHVAVAGSVLGAALLHDRFSARILVVVVPLLAAGAVYGGFHYLVDVLAGALWCVGTVAMGVLIHRGLRGDPRDGSLAGAVRERAAEDHRPDER